MKPLCVPAAAANDPASPESGSVLRGVPVHLEPRSLPRRTHKDAAHFPIPREHVGSDALTPYEQGYRDGRAEAEAARVAQDADARQRGYDAGFAKGREDGLARGVAEGRESAQRAVERHAREGRDQMEARVLLLDQLLSSVRAEVGARIAAAEDEMIALSHAVVCRILGDRLVTREGLADAMRQAVRAAAANGDLTVRLHPEDLAQLQVDPTAAEFLDRSAGKLHWIADDQVGRGGCVMTSSEGTLDARLETQLDSLRRVLLRTASSTERAC